MAIAAAGIAALGAGYAAFGPGAPWLVDHVGDGVRVWRLGRLQVDGVSGASLAGLRAARLSLRDDEGIWAEAEDVTLRWSPLAILLGDVSIQSAEAARIHILRRPALSAPNPRSGPSFDVDIAALRVTRVDLDAPVADLEAAFSLDLDLGVRKERVRRLNLDLTRLDAASDRATIRFSDAGTMALDAAIVGAPGGVFMRLLGNTEEALQLSAQGVGAEDTGRATLLGAIGGEKFLDAALSWREREWALNGEAHVRGAPVFARLAERFGADLRFEAHGAMRGAFTAHAAADNLVATLAGVKGEGLSLRGPARVTARTPNLSRLAPEILVDAAAARAEGELVMRDERSTLDLTVEAEGVSFAGQEASFAGAARVIFTDRAIDAQTNLAERGTASPLLRGAALNLALNYDRRRTRFGIERARLDGPNVLATASGWSGGGDGEFAGEWRVRRMSALASDLEGEVGGRWRLRADRERGWIGAANGAGRSLRGEPSLVPQLLGGTPTLNASFAIKDGVINVAHARVQGDKLRAAAIGAIREGRAALTLEASARGPLDLGAARIEGAADMRGRLDGDLGRPRLSLTAHFGTFEAGGLSFAAPEVTLEVAPRDARAYRGTVTASAQVNGQPARATSDIALDEAGVAFPTLVADIAALHAEGDARFDAQGPTAHVVLTGRIDNLAPGAAGEVTGEARLTPAVLVIDAQLANARVGDLAMRMASVHAEGPHDNIAARFDIAGALNRATLRFAGTGALLATRSGTEARFEGAGELAGAPVRTRAPGRAVFARDSVEAALDAQIGEGALTLNWRERGRALSGHAVLDNAPIAPLAAIWGEHGEGRISGRGAIANQGAGLAGSFDLSVADAYFSRRSNERASGRLVATLTPDRLTARVEARSTDGLVASFEADAPVATQNAPIRIALAPNRDGRASWRVNGPVAGLWAAARLNDQALSGQVNGEGSLRFGAGALTGEGALRISNGVFEDKLSGVKLQAIDARVRFGEDGAQIERFTAQDSRGGLINATGGAADPEHGRIAINVQNLRLVDRPDARALASGDLELSWEGLRSTLTGALAIQEGDISIAQPLNAGIPQLDVIEINRPVRADAPIQPPTRPPRNGSTTLDVRITAPGRVFTRGRGLDAEWSLDLRLAGSVTHPRVFGEARTIRGDLSLSGRQFEIQSGLITFDGEPSEARINLVAERTTTDLAARITLTGTADNPEIAFSSTPALPEDEILPQVLFGRGVADLSALEAAQLASSLAALSGQGSFDIAEAARSISGLDRLDVREDENGGLLVAGGVYLTRDVYVEVARTGLGQAATRVEWRMRPQLLLVTSFLPNGDQRASIRWRQERD